MARPQDRGSLTGTGENDSSRMWGGNSPRPHLQAWLIARRTFTGNNSMWKGQGACSASRHDKESLGVTRLCKEAILQVAVRPACDDSQLSTMGLPRTSGFEELTYCRLSSIPG